MGVEDTAKKMGAQVHRNPGVDEGVTPNFLPDVDLDEHQLQEKKFSHCQEVIG